MKKLTLVLIVFLCLFSVFAGGGKEEKDKSSAKIFAVVTDQVGNVVEIKKQPEKIVSGYYISSSACIALGLKDNIVAIEAQADKRPIYKLVDPQMIKLPNVGTAKSFNLETCLSVNPDLVILPAKQKETAKQLNQMGVAAIVVNPESHDQLMEMFKLIGLSTGKEKEAEKLIKYYQKKTSFVQKQVKNVSEKPVVYMGGASDFLTTVTKDMYQGSLIEIAGGINAAASINGSSKKQISYEQLIAMNPDIIVIPTNNNANGTPGYSVESILNDSTLKDIKAVKNKAVYQMPIGYEAWDSPVPSGILGTLWMMHTLHPSLYSNVEFEKDVKDFYKDFYSFDVNKTVNV